MKAENFSQDVAAIADAIQPMTQEQARFISRELWYTGVRTHDHRLTDRLRSILIRFNSLQDNVFKHEAIELIDFLLDLRLAGAGAR